MVISDTGAAKRKIKELTKEEQKAKKGKRKSISQSFKMLAYY